MYESTYFTYKGISSETFNPNYKIIITTMEDTYKINMGHKKEFQLDTSGSGKVSYFSPTIKTGNTKQLQLCVVDSADQPIELTDQIRMNIGEWLLDSNVFLPIYFDQYNDLGQYVNILDIEFNSFFGNIGYFILNVQFLDDYLYTRPIWKSITAAQTTNIVQIENKSNVKSVKPYMEVEPRESTLTITNLSTGNVLSFTNLPIGVKLKLFNEDRYICPVYKTYDINKFNWQWLELRKGINTLKIDGKCVIDMQLEFPMML